MTPATYSFLHDAWVANPFDSNVAKRNSSYSGYDDGQLIRLLETAPLGAFAHVAHDAFRDWVLDPEFSCLGGRSAMRRSTYRFGAYERFDDAAVTQGLARHLHAFGAEQGRPMFTIVRDDVGRHDFLLTPCSRETFAIIYGHTGEHPSCFENLSAALAPHGIVPDAIAVRPPRSRAGDCIELRAEIDLIVGLTACSAELSNNHAFKPIWYAIDRGSRTPWTNSASSLAR